MDDIVDRLRYGATCPVSAPGGDLAKDMLEAAAEIEKLREGIEEALDTVMNISLRCAFISDAETDDPVAERT